MKLGFIGLGAMGNPMAENIAKSDRELYVYDIDREAVEALTNHNTISCASPKEVAEHADMIMMSLPNAHIVEKVILGQDGILATAGTGKVIIDLSSVSPQTTCKMSIEAGAKGHEYIDAPVSGGVAGAVAGSLTIMVGGETKVFKKIKPILDLIGKKITHVGDVGSGDAVKIINNMLLGANMVAVAEAIVLGKKAGLSAKIMHDIIGSSSGQSYVLDNKLPNFIMKRNFQGGFAIDLQFKDLELAVDMGKHLGHPLPATNMAQQVFEVARACGYGKEDISAVVKVWEKLMNTEICE
jgi:2-hydroxymethylglutarate dehydrogenase